jgi:hypothetical protein
VGFHFQVGQAQRVTDLELLLIDDWRLMIVEGRSKAKSHFNNQKSSIANHQLSFVGHSRLMGLTPHARLLSFP